MLNKRLINLYQIKNKLKDSKLLAQLKLLTPAEFKRFYPYIRSPYFTQSKDVIKLFEGIRKYFPSFSSPHLKKEAIFKKLFPKEKYSDIKLRNLQSKLSKILESYLIQINYEKDAFAKRKLLTQIYGQRNYYPGFKKGTELLLTEIDKSPYRDMEFYYEKYLLNKAVYFHRNTPKLGKTVDLLKTAIHNLENHFVLERMHLGIDLKNREHFLSEKHDFEPFNFVPALPTDNLLFQQFQESFQLLKENDDASFFRLLSIFNKNLHKTRLPYAKIIYGLLLNITIRKAKNKRVPFLKIVFDLYKTGIKKELIFEDGKIPLSVFFNAVMVGATMKEIEWTSQFIEHNQDKLATIDEKETVLTLAVCFLRFHQKKYDAVIHELHQIKIPDNRYQFVIRNLIIRTYFHLFRQDQSYYFMLMDQCKSYHKVLQRDKVFGQVVIAEKKRFVKMVQQIVTFEFEGQLGAEQRKKLRAEVQQTHPITLKNWLLEILS